LETEAGGDGDFESAMSFTYHEEEIATMRAREIVDAVMRMRDA
jgi:hypothetical protein